MSTDPRQDAPIRLRVQAPLHWQNLAFQILDIDLTRPDRMIAASDLKTLQLPASLDAQLGLVLSGRAPLWLYAHLVHRCQAFPWLACYDPRLGAVVVASQTSSPPIGQVIPLLPPQSSVLCPAILIGGPPDSGKSTITQLLFQALLPHHPNIYLQRAHWDGEGNWLLELDPEQREAFKLRNRGTLTATFFPYHARAILELRRQKSLVLVDVGGKVQPEKQPLLESCTHYLIVTSQPEAAESWHEFCRDRGNLICLGVIHTGGNSPATVSQYQPYLEISLPAWSAEDTPLLPEELLDRVLSLLHPASEMEVASSRSLHTGQ